MSIGKQASDDGQKLQNSAKPGDDVVTTSVGSKEAPSARLEEEKLIKEVVERSRQADREVLRQVEDALGEEAKLAKPEIEIGPDLADHGVKSPEQEASSVVDNGSTIELPITEEEYKKGEHTKVNGQTNREKSVLGIRSLVALALLFGRWIKLAHKHTKRVIFKKKEIEDAS